jgi:hypothetical protein
MAKRKPAQAQAKAVREVLRRTFIGALAPATAREREPARAGPFVPPKRGRKR